MLSDSAALLRMIKYTKSEADRLEYVDVASHLEMAAEAISSDIQKLQNSILSDEIYRVVDDIARAKRLKEKFKL